MQQESKIIAILLQNLDSSKIENVSKFLSSVLYTDDRYCLNHLLLGGELNLYNKGMNIYCSIDPWVRDKIENIDFCINHEYIKVIDNIYYIKAEVSRDCEYKSTVYVNYLGCDIDGNPIVIDRDRSVQRDRILK